MTRALTSLSALVFVCACTDTSSDFAGSTPAELGAVQQEVVYGEDDRTEYYEHGDEGLKALTANSIVAMISSNAIEESGGTIRLSTRTLGQSYGLCEDELFRDQPTAASCSGTLIDDDLVLTAGHCVSSGCGNSRWVFNYYYQGAGDLHPITVEDVFDCERIVVQSMPSRRGDEPDYAIVQLDRSAAPRFQPAEVNPDQWPVAIGNNVAMIGFGSGIPAKIDDGGFVLDERRDERNYFRATTDAFGGNSGSGVFDVNDRVVGILVAGEQDYTFDGGCTRVAVLPEGGGGQGGESVTYAILAIEELCDEGWPSERLCGIAAECGDGICSLGESSEACPEDCEQDGGWTCDPSYFAARDGCDCRCGAFDPDCDDPSQETFNCDPGEVCNGAGLCEGVDPGPEPEPEPEPIPTVPADWDCEEDFYDAGDGCDCRCGAFDPDCADPQQDIFNCDPGEVCSVEGLCIEGDDDGFEPIPMPGDDMPDDGDDDSFGGFGDIIPTTGGAGSTGCSSTQGRPNPAFGLTLLLGLALRRRR